MKLTYFLRVVAVIQIVLGLGYLFAPGLFLQSMGHSAVPQDIYYPLGMLAARFIVYGSAFWLIASRPAFHRTWILGMAYIQLLDFLVGVTYTGMGIVPLSLSGFPMFNAIWIGLLCWWWAPEKNPIDSAK